MLSENPRYDDEPKMTIWKHGEVSGDVLDGLFDSDGCPHCRLSLFRLPQIVFAYDAKPERSLNSLMVCQGCGWWRLSRIVRNRFAPRIRGIAGIYRSAAILRRFSERDFREPIRDVRAFLMARWARRNNLDPLVVQDVVASVFRDLGWMILATAHRNDGGVDVVAERGGEQAAIQVKRSKNAIGVDQVREFVGALVVGHRTKGIFVTTSTFTAGSHKAALEASQEGRYVELVDSESFLRDIGIAQVAAWNPDPVELLGLVGSRCFYFGSTMQIRFPKSAHVIILDRQSRGAGDQ
jgi:restriction endonuclease